MSMVSIIITVYNQSSSIVETLESVITQTSKNFEIIIVNDGSTDNSEFLITEALRNVCVPYKYLKVKNQGVSSARNVGILNSIGDFILFLDGDDILKSNFIETIDSKSLYNFDLVCFKYDVIDENSLIISQSSNLITPKMKVQTGIEAFCSFILRDENYISLWTSSIIYNRKMIEESKLMYSPNIHVGEDVEFQMKALILSKKIKFIDFTLASYRKRVGSKMNSYNIRRFDAFLAMINVHQFVKINTSKSDILSRKALRRLNNQVLNGFIYNYAWNLKYINYSNSIIKNNFELKKNIYKYNPNLFKLYKKTLINNFFNELNLYSLLKKSLNFVFLISPVLVSKYFIIKFRI